MEVFCYPSSSMLSTGHSLGPWAESFKTGRASKLASLFLQNHTEKMEPIAVKTHTIDKTVDTGAKNFPCHICGKSYKTKFYLIRHTRIHTGEKPFSCEKCGKSFADPSAFKGHTKLHTNRNFPCNMCDKVLVSEKILKLHIKVHPGTDSSGMKVLFSNEFKVEALRKVKEIGSIKTSDLMRIPYTTLMNWINICRGEHQCKECKKGFPYSASLRKHMAKKHDPNNEDPILHRKRRTNISSVNQVDKKS